MNNFQSIHSQRLWAQRKLRYYLIQNDLPGNLSLKISLEKYCYLSGAWWPQGMGKTEFLMYEYTENEESPIYREKGAKGIITSKVKRRVRDDRVNYKQYLDSHKWARLKHEILNQRGYCCENCKEHTKFLDLHHKTYKRLGNELPEDLMLLCRWCHKKVHKIKREKNIEDIPYLSVFFENMKIA